MKTQKEKIQHKDKLSNEEVKRRKSIRNKKYNPLRKIRYANDEEYRRKDLEKGKRYRESHKEIIRIRAVRHLDKNRFGGNKQLALERDNWTCQECGMTNEQHILLFGRGISVHHKDGKGRNKKMKDRNNDLDNLITICMRCHGRLERLNYLEKKNEEML